jgi:hypothetical protein
MAAKCDSVTFGFERLVTGSQARVPISYAYIHEGRVEGREFVTERILFGWIVTWNFVRVHCMHSARGEREERKVWRRAQRKSKSVFFLFSFSLSLFSSSNIQHPFFLRHQKSCYTMLRGTILFPQHRRHSVLPRVFTWMKVHECTTYASKSWLSSVHSTREGWFFLLRKVKYVHTYCKLSPSCHFLLVTSASKSPNEGRKSDSAISSSTRAWREDVQYVLFVR